MRFVLLLWLLPFGILQAEDCWQPVSKDEMTGAWRKANPERYVRVIGDFTGTGETEYAQFEVSCKEQKVGLFAHVKWRGREHRHLLLIVPDNHIQSYGIRLASPKSYSSRCIAGHFDCDTGIKKVRPEYDGIEMFKNTDGRSIFYWDNGKFQRIWLNDEH